MLRSAAYALTEQTAVHAMTAATRGPAAVSSRNSYSNGIDRRPHSPRPTAAAEGFSNIIDATDSRKFDVRKIGTRNGIKNASVIQAEFEYALRPLQNDDPLSARIKKRQVGNCHFVEPLDNI